MANVIRVKRSGDEGATPSDLDFGELAINYNDGKIFYKNSGNEVTFLKSQRYIHLQATPKSTWVIHHDLGGHPTVSVVDSAGTLVFGQIVYTSTSTITINFTAPFSGKAYLT
jgi:hypothetical protein